MSGRRLAAAATLLLTALTVGMSRSSAGAAMLRPAADPAQEAVDAAEAFLADYVDDDGRVVRRDQGGDTVGEGQAYAMLIAAGLGDEATFRRVWNWTAANMVGEHGLLVLRWSDGTVVDSMPAADADLIVAGALVLGSQRFGDADLAATAGRLSERIIRRETTDSVLVAGPWAVSNEVVNPSYFVFPAMSQLWWNGDHRWSAIAASSRRLLAELMAAPPHLPPDWASTASDHPVAAASPGGADPRYGYEAVRVVVQLAADCDRRSRQLAAAAWPFLEREAEGTIETSYALDGTPLGNGEHPVGVVAAAAAAHAAGDTAASQRLLDRATELEGNSPSYYGAAWVALARLWLDTDLISACAD